MEWTCCRPVGRACLGACIGLEYRACFGENSFFNLHHQLMLLICICIVSCRVGRCGQLDTVHCDEMQ